MSISAIQNDTAQNTAAAAKSSGAAPSGGTNSTSSTDDSKKVEVSRTSTTSADGTVTTIITYSDGSKETRVKQGDVIISKSATQATK